ARGVSTSTSGTWRCRSSRNSACVTWKRVSLCHSVSSPSNPSTRTGIEPELSAPGQVPLTRQAELRAEPRFCYAQGQRENEGRAMAGGAAHEQEISAVGTGELTADVQAEPGAGHVLESMLPAALERLED